MIEPIAWQFRHKPTNAGWNYCSKTDAAEFAALGDYEARLLYAIPEGYKLVPVEMSGKQWGAARTAFQRVLDELEKTAGYELRSALIDRAAESIYKAMIEGEQ